MLKEYGALWGFQEKPSKHSTVFSPETANIKKLANFTANTKNYGRITLNAKPHSDLHTWVTISVRSGASSREGRLKKHYSTMPINMVFFSLFHTCSGFDLRLLRVYFGKGRVFDYDFY